MEEQEFIDPTMAFMEEFIDPYGAESPAANDPDILRNILDRAKTLAEQRYAEVSERARERGRQVRSDRGDWGWDLERAVEGATRETAPDFTLPPEVIRDYRGQWTDPEDLRKAKFTSVFGDSPSEDLREHPDFTFHTLLTEDTDELVRRATYPRGRPGVLVGRRNPVVTFGYKCGPENNERGRQCALPFNRWYRDDQRGIDTLNREAARSTQNIFDRGSRGIIPPETVVVEDATGAGENPMLGVSGRARPRIAPTLTGIRAAIKQTVNAMRAGDQLQRAQRQPQYRNLSDNL